MLSSWNKVIIIIIIITSVKYDKRPITRAIFINKVGH